MDGTYNPHDLERKIFQFWREQNLFVPSSLEKDAPSYAILMPPPNVTNVLHLGHALNNTLQDVMARYYRMKGFAVMWKIGVDHAGIATQNMVEKELRKEGTDRFKLGKEKFVERVWEWKKLYGHKILDQLQSLGISGDWAHDRFTMDEVSSRAVKEIFVRLYKDNLLYRGEYLINWCTHCLTTISDDEVEHVEYDGFIYEIAYPIEGTEESIIIATTRPETILGDVALAVSPKDDRYKSLVGKRVNIPLFNRIIPIIADDGVEEDFGTGVLKITPGNAPLDFEIGKKHGLPSIEIMDEQGKMNALAGEYEGLDRFEYRKVFVRLLSEAGFLKESKPHHHARGTCYRCHNVIENRVSTQWFVKMAPLAGKAKEVLVQEKVSFEPKKWEKVYFHWMDNIKDWSISRQLWWGHPLPAYYCSNGHINVSVDIPTVCSECGQSDLTPDPDVLDTWFSSWIWPFTVFDAQYFTKNDWQTEEFKRYYPTQYLATAPEILFFWVARMIMAGLYLTDEVPFSKVFFNSTVCDMQGRKMSKSLGNGIDPMDIIKDYGADALRFTLLFVAPKGERIRMESKTFETGARLVNKLWNAARFVLGEKPENLSLEESDVEPRDLWEAYILKRYEESAKIMGKALEEFDYYTATHTIYHFFWDDFCDWFLESRKILLKKDSQEEKGHLYRFLELILDGILRLFHPFIPFITEEIWQNLFYKKGSSIMKKDFSLFSSSVLAKDFSFLGNASSVMNLVAEIRSIQLEFQLQEPLEMLINSSQESADSIIKNHFIWSVSSELHSWVNISLIKESSSPLKLFLTHLDGVDFYLLLPSTLDLKVFKTRLDKSLERALSEKQRAINKLQNPKFKENALPSLLELEEEKIIKYEQQIKRIHRILESGEF